MMRQFEVLGKGTVSDPRRLYLINTDRWDYLWGFHRYIKDL